MNNLIISIATNLFCIHLLCLVFNGTQYINIGNRSQIYIIIVSLATIKLIFNKITISSLDIMLYSTLILYTILSPFFINENYQNGTLFASLLLFSLLLTWSNLRFSEHQIKRIMFFYRLSAVIISLGVMLCRYKPYTGVMMSRMTILSFTGEFYDVNFLSAIIVIPGIISIYELLHSNFNIYKLMENIIIAIGVVLMGSRAALALMIGAWILLILRHNYSNIKKMLLGLILLFLIAIMFFILPTDMLEHYYRGINPLDDSRRMKDWGYGINLLEINPLWGYGMMSSKHIITDLFKELYTVHNTYLVILINYGLIFGLIVYAVMLLPLVRLIKYNAPFVYVTAYIAYLLSIIVIEANYSEVMIIPLCVFSAVAIYYKGVYQKTTIISQFTNHKS